MANTIHRLDDLGRCSRPRSWLRMVTHSRTASIGEEAPAFSLTDQHGTVFHLTEAIGAGPVVLVFLRGFG